MAPLQMQEIKTLVPLLNMSKMNEEGKTSSLCKPDIVYKLYRTHGFRHLRVFRLMPVPG